MDSTLHTTARATSAVASLIFALAAQDALAAQVFFSNFDTGMPPQVNAGTAATEDVQGYAGKGPPRNPFSGHFLRSESLNPVTVTLTGLPAHKYLSLDFLFAAIDSLDGSGDTWPFGDYFSVSLDGTTIFRESFANAAINFVQSYVPSKPSFEIARRQDLGFGTGGYFFDSAYALGREPVFKNIPHTAPTATIVFLLDGPGAQAKVDESWAIDNLKITVSKQPR